MGKRVLIVAPETDLHGRVVAERLGRLGARVDFWNATLFPWVQRVSWVPGSSLQGRLGAPANLDTYDRIWWRRFQRPTPPPVIEDAHVKKFCASEAEALTRGILSLQHGRIVNHPEVERYINRKVVQLQMALDGNIRIPRTLVSNDKERIAAFIDANQECIVKPISNDYPHCIETRLCSKDDVTEDCIVGLAPHIYQELIVARLDVRVFVAGDTVFAGELSREDTNTRVDWRMQAVGWKQHALPKSVEEALCLLTERMGLYSASHDLRMTPDGEYVFLETNPSGQFLFLEIDCALPLSETFATMLLSEPLLLRQVPVTSGFSFV